VNTGAVDDLAALADLCAEHGLWFHVDGAIGAPLAISDKLRAMLHGMERADSLAFDLHKWMQMPYDVGCVLVRDQAQHREAFSEAAAYLSRMPRALCSGERWFSDYGPELSRGFRALKVWMCLKQHGLRKYGELFEQNVEQAGYLAGLVESTRELELISRGELNIVCLRYRGRVRDGQALNALNRELLMRLQEQGIAAPRSLFSMESSLSGYQFVIIGREWTTLIFSCARSCALGGRSNNQQPELPLARRRHGELCAPHVPE
jgi:aromatic-L-amino-acid/L-tryptophan decarboxylase